MVLRVRYELVALLQDGPIFAAYQARDRVLNRDVCVRLFKPPFSFDQPFTDGVLQAVRRSAMAQHPNLEPLWEVETDDSQSYIVGELTMGQVLQERIRKLAPFSVPVSVATSIGILEALDSVHRAGLVHGDVGAHNVLIRNDGQVRLQLSGIWEAYGDSPAAGGMVLPSMAPYLAPEISAGGDPTSTSDVYALGILLFQLLTGRRPYNADRPVAMAMEHATHETPNPRTLNPSVPHVLGEIVAKAMSKRPEERYATAGEMLKDLRMLQDALRFGRTLSWPIQPGAPAPVTVSPGTTTTPAPAGKEPSPVAPRMSAIRDEVDDQTRARRRQDRDVPVWMLVSITFFVAVLACMVGVWMILNLNRPKLVTVPNVKGQPLAEARQIVEGMKLQFRISPSRQNDESVAADSVVSVDPPVGEKVREGGTVTVRLSAGSKFVEVPDLKGLTADRAKSALEALDLQLDRAAQRVPSSTVPAESVVDQSPPPKTKVERQTRVRLIVSSGPSTEEPTADAAEDARTYTLTMRTTGVKQNVEVKIELEDARETKTIYVGQHGADEEFEVSATGYGREVTFKIYYDGELVREVKRRAEDEGPR